MLIAERSRLEPVKILVSNSLVHIELFKNKNGNLFISSATDEPSGTVYFATTASLFCLFLENAITFQALFNQSPSIFVEISNNVKSALFSTSDIDVKLACGDKTILEITGEIPMEIWHGLA